MLMEEEQEGVYCYICYKSHRVHLEGSCGHHACQPCIADWMKEKTKTCSLCRMDWNEIALSPITIGGPDDKNADHLLRGQLDEFQKNYLRSGRK